MMTLMASANAITAAAPFREDEEATYAIATTCQDGTDLQYLLDVLDLTPVREPWTVLRVQRRVLECGTGTFTSIVMRHFVPRRAHRLLGSAFASLLNSQLIRDTGLYRDGVSHYELTTTGSDIASRLRSARPQPHEVILLHSRFTLRGDAEW